MRINKDKEFLTTPCREVTSSEASSIKMKLFNGIKPRMKDAVGLAANQISIPKRAFVTNHNGKLKYYINPVLIKYKGEDFDHREGCLSLPGQEHSVKRYPEVEVSDDLHGTQTLTGFPAIVWQHEYDHCCGILI